MSGPSAAMVLRKRLAKADGKVLKLNDLPPYLQMAISAEENRCQVYSLNRLNREGTVHLHTAETLLGGEPLEGYVVTSEPVSDGFQFYIALEGTPLDRVSIEPDDLRTFSCIVRQLQKKPHLFIKHASS